MIAVTFALPSESSDFVRLLRGQSSTPAGSPATSDRPRGQKVCVWHTGVGEKTARIRLESLLREQTPKLLISSGFAGALSDRLNVGDLLLAENYSAPALASAVRSLPEPFPHVVGRLATAAAMIDTPEDRQELARKEKADAVDMETHFISEACAAAGVPMLSLRVISDSPAAPFPVPAHILFNVEQQRTAFLPLVAHLMRHPAALGRIISFARRIAVARKSLARALDILVRSEPLQL